MSEKILYTIQQMSAYEHHAEHFYLYQEELTIELDNLESDFTQNIINEIILWKVNRYAKIDQSALNTLNRIKKTDRDINEELTREILIELLEVKGIRLAMASTILRFKNPDVYQIIDQRAFRILYGYESNYDLKKPNEQIEIYLDYLKKLKNDCYKYKIPFENADRILYSLDKKHNQDIKLKNYGGK